MDHPARARVAEIMVARVGGTSQERTRGSGYLISPGWVLTAHHVVKDAASVGVWLGAPPELAPKAGVAVDAGRVLAVPAADLALLPLSGQADDPHCEPAPFGRLDREPGPPVPVAAAGCPRFKLREAPDRPGVLLRELDYAIGSIAALSDAKTGRFAFAVDVPPGPDPEPGKHSPWEGMSGAAVWASNRLIGVVGQHHLQEGLATLTVRPVEQLFSAASASQLEAWRAALPRLPATAGALWLATPPTVRKIEVARARRAAEALAPQVLIGRGAELAALEEFAGSGTRWRWIQGDAFAGKTALMAWFALHPPERVDVAACFLRRASGEDTAEYALDVLTRQLAQLADRRGYLPPPFVSERGNDFADLLEAAARACAERDRRVVVLVDGLDEYDPAPASLDLADWLPGHRTLPDQAKLLAASRAGADVRLPPGHPLSSSPQRISASEAASEIQQAARTELDRAVRTPGGFLLHLLCCLAVAGSGLTASELCALLKLRGDDPDVSEIEAQLSSSLGRSLMRLPHLDGAGEPAYAFAHETLLGEARSRFASDLPTYDDLLHTWASEYAQTDWPDDTPQYLLAPYTRELARRARDSAGPGARRGKPISGALDRLSALARSPSRHAFLLRATRSDYAALTEIRTAQSLLADQDVPDLQALIELGLHQYVLSISNYIPYGLPKVWAQLARFDHAEALAGAMTDSKYQVESLASVAAAAAQAGDLDRAFRVATDAAARARTILDPGDYFRALEGVVTAIAQAGAADRAEILARTFPDVRSQASMLGELATHASEADRARRIIADAEALARTIADPYHQAGILSQLADAAAQFRDFAQAHRMAKDAVVLICANYNPNEERAQNMLLFTAITQVRRLGELAAVVAQAGDADLAFRMVADAEVLASAFPDVAAQARVLDELATAIAQGGDLGRAETLARAIPSRSYRAAALGKLACIAAQAGDPDNANRIAADAEDLAHTIITEGQRWILHQWLAAAIQAGDLDRAEAFARTIGDPDSQAGALLGLVTAATQAGDSDRARRILADTHALAHTITDPDSQESNLRHLATAAARAGDLDRAEGIARDIIDTNARPWALAGLVVAIAEAGDPDRAEAIADAITDPGTKAQALSDLATATARADDIGRAHRILADAEALARTITVPDDRAQMLTTLATTAAEAGDYDRAEALARTVTGSKAQSQVLTNIASAAAKASEAGFAERMAADAEALARTITDPDAQAQVLTTLATTAAKAGGPGRALQIITDAAALARNVTAVGVKVPMFIDLVTAAAQADNLERLHEMAAEAEAVINAITDPNSRALWARDLATAIARTGNPGRAEDLARTITGPGAKARALSDLATAAAQAGDSERADRLATDAEAIARTIADPTPRAHVLTDLAAAAAQTRDPDRANRIASDVEALTGVITDPNSQRLARTELAAVIGQVGDLDRAYQMAIEASTSARRGEYAPPLRQEYAWTQALRKVAVAIAQAGDPDRAEALARSIGNVNVRAFTFVKLAVAVAESGDLGRAEVMARALTNHFAQAQALAELVTAAIQADDPERAHRIAIDAEALTRTFAYPHARARTLTTLANAVGQYGDLDHTRHLLAQAASAGSPEIGGWMRVASQFFPSAVKNAGDSFMGVYPG